MHQKLLSLSAVALMVFGFGVVAASPVCELDGGNFNATVQSGVYVIFFYKYWCHGCRRFERTVYSPLAFEINKPNVKFCKIDCQGEQSGQICDQLEVACPNINVFDSGTSVFSTTNFTAKEVKVKLTDFLAKY